MSCPSPLVFPTAAISTQFRGRCKKTSEPTMRKGSECFRYGISFYCSFTDIKIHIPRYQLPGTVGRRGRKSPARIIFSSSILYILASQYLSTSLLPCEFMAQHFSFFNWKLYQFLETISLLSHTFIQFSSAGRVPPH